MPTNSVQIPASGTYPHGCKGMLAWGDGYAEEMLLESFDPTPVRSGPLSVVENDEGDEVQVNLLKGSGGFDATASGPYSTEYTLPEVGDFVKYTRPDETVFYCFVASTPVIGGKRVAAATLSLKVSYRPLIQPEVTPP